MQEENRRSPKSETHGYSRYRSETAENSRSFPSIPQQRPPIIGCEQKRPPWRQPLYTWSLDISLRQESPGARRALPSLRAAGRPSRAPPADARRARQAPHPQRGSIPCEGHEQKRLPWREPLHTWSQRQESPGAPAPSIRCGASRPLAGSAGERSTRSLSSAPPTGFDSGARLQKARLRRGNRASKGLWSQRQESNPQPTDYKSVALPLSHAGTLGARAQSSIRIPKLLDKGKCGTH